MVTPELGAKYREAMRATLSHLVRPARENARWHRDRHKATRDRYHLGQWKAYSRVALRLSRLELP